MVLALVFGLLGLETVLDLFTSFLMEGKHVNYVWLLNFSSGLFCAFVFLQFLPDLFEGFSLLGWSMFLFMFLGFVLFLLFQLHRYKSISRKGVVSAEGSCICAEFFIDGMAVFLFLSNKDLLIGLLLMCPFILSAQTASLAVKELYKKYCVSKWFGLYFDSFLFFGAIFAFLTSSDMQLFYSVFAFVAGAFLYFILHDLLPKESRIQTKPFVAGLLICIAIILPIRLFNMNI